jgi:putative FmdB family regulatory protein
MPTYVYKCAACAHEFEKEQKISDPPAKACPKCKKAKAERQIAGSSFILQGAGWYRDGKNK